MPHFEVITQIDASPERVFDACLEVEMHTASMAGSGESVVGGVRSGRLGEGDHVTFRGRHFGLRWRLAARVSGLDRPNSFVDDQERGPFKRWHHAHHFAPDGNGGTVMRDVIDYAAPLGPLGALVERMGLHSYMVRLIRIRNRYLKEVLESS